MLKCVDYEQVNNIEFMKFCLTKLKLRELKVMCFKGHV